MKNPKNKAKTSTRTVTWLAIPLLGIYIQRKWHHCVKEILALPCLLQHTDMGYNYLKYPLNRENIIVSLYHTHAPLFSTPKNDTLSLTATFIEVCYHYVK